MVFGEKERKINELEKTNELLQKRVLGAEREVSNLRIELAMARAALSTMPQIETELKNFFDGPNIIELATEMARKKVTEDERQRMLGALAANLAEEHGDEYRTDYRVTEGPQLRDELDRLSASDGTYEKVEQDVATEVRTEIQAELIAERREQILKELSDPVKRAEFMAEISTELISSAPLEKYRRETRAKLEGEWKNEATAEVTTTITEEEHAREKTFKEEFVAAFLESDKGKRLRNQIRRSLEVEWGKASLELIASKIGDEELLELLTKSANQAKEKLSRETFAKQLLGDFEHGGVDTTKLGKGAKLEIFLGEFESVTVTESAQDSYGYSTRKKVEKDVLTYERKLTLSSLGEGRFVVNEDTLHDAPSVYAKNDAIQHGRVITIGRRVTENGEIQLHPFLTAGVELFYDTDTTDPEITEAHLPVANIIVNGISARNAEVTKAA